MAPRKPNMLIIGAQKAGSTWLYDTLRAHPDVFLPRRVELLYFNRLSNCNSDGFAAYLEHFGSATDQKVVGEKTPSYFWTYDASSPFAAAVRDMNPDIPGSVKAFLGDDVKLVASLRHPVWRAVSAYYHHVKRGRIAAEVPLRETPARFGIVDLGFYGRHLKAWLDAFSREQIHICLMEDDIVSRPDACYSEICRFLGIETIKLPQVGNKRSNEGVPTWVDRDGIHAVGYPDHIVSPADLAFLLEVYRSDRLEIETILGRRLLVWEQQDRALECYLERARLTAGKIIKSNHPNDSVVVEAPAMLRAGAGLAASRLGAFSTVAKDVRGSATVGRYCHVGRGVKLGGSPCGRGRSWIAGILGRLYVTKDQPNTRRQAKTPSINIGNDVKIGNSCVIGDGVLIGDGAVVRDKAVVTTDVAPFAIVGGTPSRVLRYRYPKIVRDDLLRIRWWQYAKTDLEDVDFSDIGGALKEISRRARLKTLLPYFGAFVQR